MSRHNRRRTRGGHKSGISSHFTSFDLALSSPASSSQQSLPLQATFFSNKPNTSRRNGPSARHWHNRYMAWQARDQRHRQEKASLEAEKKRIFGDSEEEDSTGEDEMLCEKMLEYFVGLDFIDT